MTQAIGRQPNEMMEDKIWEEWQDGDDSALYDSGYYDGVLKAIGIIDGCLEQEQLDRLPASWMLKVIKHTLQTEVSVGG